MSKIRMWCLAYGTHRKGTKIAESPSLTNLCHSNWLNNVLKAIEATVGSYPEGSYETTSGASFPRWILWHSTGIAVDALTEKICENANSLPAPLYSSLSGANVNSWQA